MKSRNRTAFLRSACWLLAGTLLSGTARAENAADTEAVVVTGIRQAYRGDFTTREIPQSIAVIDAQTLADNNLLRLTDALDFNASISRQNNLGGMWDAFAVRGFVGDENLPSGYLVNGFNGGRGFGGPRDVAGLESIEVLKGPAAALYGRGEPGGTVNLVTKQARIGETFGSGSAQYGSFDRVRGEADLNLALGNALTVRLIGYGEQADSFRDTITSRRWGFLPSVGLKLGDSTRLTYDLEWTRTEAPFDRGIVALNNNFGIVPINRFLGEPGDGDHVARALGHQLRLEHAFNANWSVQVGASYRDTKLTGVSSDAALGGARQKLFRDGVSLSRERRSRRYDSEHLVLRAELSGRFTLAGMEHRILLGADHDEFDNDQDFRRRRPPALASSPSDQAGYVINIVNPVYGRFTPPEPAPNTNRLDIQIATGAYLQDQISLTDRLQLRLGGRFDHVKLRVENRLTGVQSNLGADRFSPQVGLVYNTADWLSLYAVYGEGFRANIGTDAAGRIFDPETTRSIEGGAKLSLLDGKLTGTLAVFQMDKTNVLATDTVNIGFLVAIGKARSRGAEVDLTGRLPGNLELRLSYAYVDAEARSAVIDPNSVQIASGDSLLNIPRHTVNVQLAHDMAIGAVNGRIGIGLQHVGTRLGETGTAFMLPSHTLVRLFARANLTKNIEVFGEVQNLFNRRWFANSYSTLWVQPGAPRTASIGVRARF